MSSKDHKGDDTSFVEYIKKSRGDAAAAMQKLASAQSGDMTPGRFASLFCPAGFEFNYANDAISVKLEDDYFLQKEEKYILHYVQLSNLHPRLRNTSITLEKAEWLQLFVPKSNVQSAKLRGKENLGVSGDVECDKEDSSLLELWCKVFYARDVPSTF